MKSDKIKKLLASLLLAAAFLGAFHHHEDTGIHHDCPIYLLQSNLTAPDLPKTALPEEIAFFYHPVRVSTRIWNHESILTAYTSRAPPLFS